MKRKLHSFGVLAALCCCTLGYAISGNSPQRLFKQISSTVKELVGQSDDKIRLTLPESEVRRMLSQVTPSRAMHKVPEAGADSTEAALYQSFTDTLWMNNHAPGQENVSLSPASEGVTVNENGVVTITTQKGVTNYFVTGAENQNFAWQARNARRYYFTAKISSDKDVVVQPALVYQTNGSLYAANSGRLTLNSDNNHTAKFCLEAEGIPENSNLVLGFLTDEDTAETTFEVSEITFIGKCKALRSEEWSTDNDLPGLGLNSYSQNQYVVKCNNTTSIGVIYYNGVGHMTGINTTDTEFVMPENIMIDGEPVILNEFGYNGKFDWSGAPNLKVLDLTSANKVSVDYTDSHITDIYRNTTEVFNDNSKNKDSIYLHVYYNYGAGKYNGYKRVLVNGEKPEYPILKNSDFVVAGKSEGDYFGITYKNGFIISEIYSQRDTVELPQTITINGWGIATVTNCGRDNETWSGTLCENAPNLKSLIVPKDYTTLNIYWNQSPLTELHIHGNTPSTRWDVPSDMDVYVALQSSYSNYCNTSAWKNANLIPDGWDFEWLTVDVKRKGEFAQTYIEMTNADWKAGVNVKVKGALNESDLKNFQLLTNLRKLDLSEAQFGKIPQSFLRNNKTLYEVSLPKEVTEIGEYAFQQCSKLTKVTAPGVKTLEAYAFDGDSRLEEFDLSNVTVIEEYTFRDCSRYAPTRLADKLYFIGSYAFYNTAIQEVTIPEGISVLKSYSFGNCKQLKKVVLPSKLKNIGEGAFADCTMLPEISIPETVENIGSYAFYSCTSLTELTIPSNVKEVGYSFISKCSSLTSIKCKAVMPPRATGSFVSGIDRNHCTLFVAPFTIDAFREADCWKEFYIMKPLEEPVKNIYINRPMAFDLQSADNAVLQGNPNMTLDYTNVDWNWYVGQLSASGDGTLSAGVFNIINRFDCRSNQGNDYRPTLVNNAENMRADSVVCTIELNSDYWHFISFPYDVKVSDIHGLNHTDYAIRQYNSLRRATGEGEGNWEDVPADGTLEAGKGYIIKAANHYKESLNNTFAPKVVFPSRNTVTKNRLFSSDDAIVPLTEYPAEFAHNRSWNLMGNPYPCYYDMRCLKDEFTTPIVLWRGDSYQAYSPVDDYIILRPGEAFFVQRPIDVEQMKFGVEGRMHRAAALAANGTPIYKAPATESKLGSNRSVFNFVVEGGGNDDRTRIVINEEATMDYNTNTDASKFFAETCKGTEIFVSGDVCYDICERPLADGTAVIGLRTAQEGSYALSLNGRNIEGWTVVLTDTETGRSVVLNDAPYHFEAKAGNTPARFQVSFKHNETTGIEEAISADAHVSVYNTAGVKIYEGQLNGFKATTGVYVVVSAEKAVKMAVK